MVCIAAAPLCLASDTHQPQQSPIERSSCTTTNTPHTLTGGVALGLSIVASCWLS